MELQQGAGFRFNTEQKQMEPLPSMPVALSFKHYVDSAFDWALRTEGNFIAVNCLDYSEGWKNIWPKVHRYLNHAAKKLVNTELSIEGLSLQYIDRFIYEGQMDLYKTSTVFDEKSEYLNNKVTKVGPFWHIHQGWFEGVKELSVRVLNILNITAALADKEHHTTIDHSATVQFRQRITNHKTLFEDTIQGKVAIDYYFNLLHDKNKEVLSDLLNEERIEDINLK